MSRMRSASQDEHPKTCTHPKTCKAQRCTNGCGKYEHKQGNELAAACLIHDPEHGRRCWCGPGLIIQVRAALGDQSASPVGGEEAKAANKPGSSPNLNLDASDLLADIDTFPTEKFFLIDEDGRVQPLGGKVFQRHNCTPVERDLT